MTDRDRFELEMSPGAQPPSGVGDRILVGLAVFVLIGGAVIAVGNALPDPDEAAQASEDPSSRPERTPRPSPTPEPPRVATLEEPDVEFSPPEQFNAFSGWIRALSDVVIWSSIDEHATQVGVLAKGEVAYADQGAEPAEAPGWLSLQEPVGWIKSLEGGIERVRRYEYPRYRYSGWVGGISAGPEGFLALVTPPADPDTYGPGLTASSTDGGTWRSADAPFFDAWNGSIAWGPIGWLVASHASDEGQGRIFIWNSADGLRWTRLGMLAGVTSEYVTRLLGSADGYLLETYSERGGYSPSGNTIWSSSDGQTWHESIDPVLQHAVLGERRIVAFQHGFYLWHDGVDPANHTSFGAFSLDGQTWSEVESVPDGLSLQLTEFEGRIVAIDLNWDTLAPRVWSAVVERDQVSWIRESASDAAFSGGVVRQLVSDGSRVFAFGWDLSTEEPLVWSGNGVHWLRTSLPEAFGGIPTLAAGGPTGVVVVGQRHTLRGDNPIFWHRTVTGRWVPESEPLLEMVPNPPTDQCPELPNDVLELVVVDAAAVITCHGDAPITFRAYSERCDGCFGEREDNPQPAWLMNPSTNQLYLAPNDRTGGWSTSAVLGPALVPLNPDWTGAWVEVTGHFDDPAAVTCHVEPTPGDIQWWTGTAALVDQCRQTFVVTGVRVVSGP